MKIRINQQGISHLLLPLALVVVGVSVLGFWAVSKGSADSVASQCRSAGGVYYSNANIKNHGPCWKTSGAYLVNVLKGGNRIDQVTRGQSVHMNRANYVIVVSGTWKVCIAQTAYGDRCATNYLDRGVHNLCNPRLWDNLSGNYRKVCANDGIYIERLSHQ